MFRNIPDNLLADRERSASERVDKQRVDDRTYALARIEFGLHNQQIGMGRR
ncbi:MAG: hypothetical protein MO852_12660 [Candidatus Devosia euplotis]|nr:hypothetical protein [Candidatus Devosia euplotis]